MIFIYFSFSVKYLRRDFRGWRILAVGLFGVDVMQTFMILLAGSLSGEICARFSIFTNGYYFMLFYEENLRKYR